MSKLYEKYERLKNNDFDTLYLFCCGNFYIALDSDAIILNELFDMKLTKFSNECDKCGFPIVALEKYEEKFKKYNIKYQIIKNNEDKNVKLEDIKNLLSSVNLIELSKIELIDMLDSIKKIIME